jgi:hypothetical protein
LTVYDKYEGNNDEDKEQENGEQEEEEFYTTRDLHNAPRNAH